MCTKELDQKNKYVCIDKLQFTCLIMYVLYIVGDYFHQILMDYSFKLTSTFGLENWQSMNP